MESHLLLYTAIMKSGESVRTRVANASLRDGVVRVTIIIIRKINPKLLLQFRVEDVTFSFTEHNI